MSQYFKFVNSTKEIESTLPLPFNFNLPWAKNLDENSEPDLLQIFAFVRQGNQWSEGDEVVAIGDYGLMLFPPSPKAVHVVRETSPPYQVGAKMTFSDYFKLTIASDEVAEMVGCHYQRQHLTLPTAQVELQQINTLEHRLRRNLMRVGMHNETARREFLIAPLLEHLLDYSDTKVTVERALYVSHQLQGALDYFVEAQQGFVVIEAKQGDLQRGFHQLMAELVALDQHPSTKRSDAMYGAVTTGDAWQFGHFDRQTKMITQDIELYTIPAHTSQLLHILLGILTGA